MSLSQKHSGKVLVPWFNIAEWNAVYNLIYTDDAKNWPKALQVLKVWKLRTPLLSAGVEGTLIILEALLIDRNKLSSYEITHIFSTSLVRFLNLCAANSDKQGTFYKTAMKNELPKWLISVRHDVAHSHNVPSQSMLELSLKYCLDWLKQKYWEVQGDCMSDLNVNELDCTLLEDAIYVYTHLTQCENIDNNKKLMKRVHKIMNSASKKHHSLKKISEGVNRSLKDVIRSNAQGAADKIFSLLIDTYTFLSTNYESNTTRAKKIPKAVLNNWNTLLNIIYETEIMPIFIYKLFQFVCNDRHDLLYREVASLWILEIFQGLINKENNCEDNEGLHFNSQNTSMKDKKFVAEVLDELTPFTLNFIKEVLEYNNAPPQFIEDAINLMSAFSNVADTETNGIFTSDDLHFNMTDFPINEYDGAHSSTRWTLIEDTSLYKNLPLGVLPHQPRHINPLLDLF